MALARLRFLGDGANSRAAAAAGKALVAAAMTLRFNGMALRRCDLAAMILRESN
jgi:hypothetical protein